MDGIDLTKIPAVPPPPGVTPNFIDPPSRAQLPKVFTYVTLPPMVLFVALRLYSRIRYTRLGLDDYLCFLAAASSIVNSVFAFIVVAQAAGPHMWDVPASKITVSYAQNSTILALIYFPSALFIKAAILVLYRRVFLPSRLANAATWIGLVFTPLFYIALMIVYLATCIPRAEDYATGGWLSPVYEPRAYQYDGTIAAISGVVGTVIDFYILGLPLICLSGLHMSLKRKAGIASIFLAGTSACVFSIAGCFYRMKIATSDEQVSDLSWNAVPIYAMNIGEVNLGIMCSCMPVIFVLLKGATAWSIAWVSKLRYQISSNRKNDSSGGPSNIRMAQYRDIDSEPLPSVPKARFTRLKSLMRNFERTKPAGTQSELLTFQSSDYNFHEHLKESARTRE